MGQFSPLAVSPPATWATSPRPSAPSPLTYSRRFLHSGLLRSHALSNDLHSSQSASVLPRTIYGGLRLNSTSSAPYTSSPPPPKPVPTLRTHPWRFITTFGVVHPILHYTIFLPPIYLLCSQTGFATWILAGPSGAALLKTRIPEWIPNGTVYGLRDTRERVRKRWEKKGSHEKKRIEQTSVEQEQASPNKQRGWVGSLVSKGLDQIPVPSQLSGITDKGKDYLVEKAQAKAGSIESQATAGSPVVASGSQPTIEDWMETTIYKSIAYTIKTGKALGGFIKAQRSEEPPSLEDIKAIKDDELNQGGARGWLATQFKGHTEDMRIRSVVDALTAWLVVKVSCRRVAPYLNVVD